MLQSMLEVLEYGKALHRGASPWLGEERRPPKRPMPLPLPQTARGSAAHAAMVHQALPAMTRHDLDLIAINQREYENKDVK